MTTTPIKRQLEGEVVSASANKTRVVLVSRVQVHPKYGKRFRTSQRYQAHDEQNTYKLGDRVVIEETRPYSRTKRFRIVSKVKA
jgi:small subunit ribosomal protein S17